MIDLSAFADLGPFFAVDTHAAPPGPPWRPLVELVTDPVALDARIEQVRAALGVTPEVEPRVAASVAQLGLVARLLSPLLALAAGGVEPDVPLADCHWQPEVGGPFPLSLPVTLLRTTDDGSAPGSLRTALDGPVTELVDAVRDRSGLAGHVLWGNVASAVHGAGQLARAGRPDLAARVDDVVADALDHPRVRNEHDQVDGRFRRRSCCLIYRTAGRVPDRTALCGDCVLATPG